MSKKVLTTLRGAMDIVDWEWLQDADPRLADALSTEVANGADPDEVERFLRDEYGTNREGLARRMRSAARHLHAQKRA